MKFPHYLKLIYHKKQFQSSILKKFYQDTLQYNDGIPQSKILYLIETFNYLNIKLPPSYHIVNILIYALYSLPCYSKY